MSEDSGNALPDDVRQALTQVERTYQERWADHEKRLARDTQRRAEARFHQAWRRLRQAGDDGEFARTLVELTAEFCAAAALLRVAGKSVRVEAQRGGAPADGASFLLAESPACAQAVETGETLVALKSERELSAPLLALFPDTAVPHSALVPVGGRRQVAALLYAEAGTEPVNLPALEVLAGLAGSSWEGRFAAAPVTAGPGLIQLQPPVAPAPAPPARPAWAALSEREKEVHLRAQNFARITVARLLLEHFESVREGRGRRDLFSRFREPLETARAEFRQQFMTVPSMVDYLHLELVKTLANDNLLLLGAAYPGPQV